MEMLRLREYQDTEGHSPFANWFSDLDVTAAAKVTVAIARIEQGNHSNVKGVAEGVLEYRIDFGPGYRVFRTRWRRAGDPARRRHQETAATRYWRGQGALGRSQTAQTIGEMKHGSDPRL